ncbi:hypothetical protein Acid345_2434 [Candidatus Koribacter versatilis Ellin345]|uniref:Uncharacterized protein n=1 Tax=Koribacter versatilis (strain Ellin345) TaxID=204669 RepID=Q1INW5_KORVE|nr:hypothetical protein [Candidatus Koribacter versatilis]ABF41435.1 hypothetical protein Acid345_2434 [Candidatus Koribacter versatilis Ellin345]
MELHFCNEELNLIANLLMEHGDKSHAQDILLRKILSQDLVFDGEQLALLDEFLKGVQHNLRHSALRHGDAANDPDLTTTMATLEGALEKVEEACATA